MGETRLLQRLRATEANPLRRSRHDPNRVVESVLEYLQRILNTRQGNVPLGEDFGVPDFTDIVLSYPDGVQDFEKSIRQAILKYEPRLKGVRVRFVQDENDPLSIRFNITGRLAVEDFKDQVFFESTVNSGGLIEVKR